MDQKPFWQSRTIWVNGLAMLGLIVQSQTGFVVGAEAQAAGLVVINTILRAVTRGAVAWK